MCIRDSVNPAAGNPDSPDGLPAFTDGLGLGASGLTGLLNDFPGAGVPAKRIQYTLPEARDIGEIRMFTGNDGKDGRVFHTYTVEFSSDSGVTWSEPIYVQSHASGTLNNAGNNNWRNVLSQLTEPEGLLAAGVTDLRFDIYSVDNTGGQMRDPFDGVNPFTSLDDGLTAAFVSPLVWEIDVLPVQPVVTPTARALEIAGGLRAATETDAFDLDTESAPPSNGVVDLLDALRQALLRASQTRASGA